MQRTVIRDTESVSASTVLRLLSSLQGKCWKRRCTVMAIPLVVIRIHRDTIGQIHAVMTTMTKAVVRRFKARGTARRDFVRRVVKSLLRR